MTLILFYHVAYRSLSSKEKKFVVQKTENFPLQLSPKEHYLQVPICTLECRNRELDVVDRGDLLQRDCSIVEIKIANQTRTHRHCALSFFVKIVRHTNDVALEP